MKICNLQTFWITERSDYVEITDADIQECRDHEDDPYTGETDSDFLSYAKDILENKDADFYPDCIQRMRRDLVDFVSRTEIKNSLENSGASRLICEDNEGYITAEEQFSM